MILTAGLNAINADSGEKPKRIQANNNNSFVRVSVKNVTTNKRQEKNTSPLNK